MGTQADGIACGQCGRFVLNGELHQCDTLVITAGAPPAPDSAFKGGCLSAGGTMERGASGVLSCGCAYENGRAVHLCSYHFGRRCAVAGADYRRMLVEQGVVGAADEFVVPLPGRAEGPWSTTTALTIKLAALWGAIVGEAPSQVLRDEAAPSPPCAACDALDSKCWRHR